MYFHAEQQNSTQRNANELAIALRAQSVNAATFPIVYIKIDFVYSFFPRRDSWVYS